MFRLGRTSGSLCCLCTPSDPAGWILEYPTGNSPTNRTRIRTHSLYRVAFPKHGGAEFAEVTDHLADMEERVYLLMDAPGV